jgi:hypothetical protein
MSLPLSLVMLSSKHSLVGRQRVKTGTAQNSAALPAPKQAPAMDRKDDMAHWGGVLVSKAPPDTPARPANAPVPAPNAPLAPPTAGCYNAEMPSCWTMVTLFCATVTRFGRCLRARPVPVTGGEHCASEPPSIRNFSAPSALASCKPIRPRPNHGTAVLATSARSTPNVS